MARRFDSSSTETVAKAVARVQHALPATEVAEVDETGEAAGLDHVYELNSISVTRALINAGNFTQAELAQGTGLAIDTIRHITTDRCRPCMGLLENYLMTHSDRIPVLEPYIPGVPLYRLQNKPGTEHDPGVYQLHVIVPFSSLVHALAKKHSLRDSSLRIVSDAPHSPLRWLKPALRPMYSRTTYFEGLERALLEIDRANPHPVVGKYPSDYFYTITRIDPPSLV